MLCKGMQRWIIHIDMDAFFASVEQLDHPEWRGKPVIVGGEERGVVSAASYEARAYGVHSAMPSFQARKLCPHGIFTRGNRKRYMEVSKQIMEVLQEFSPLVEQASIDEAYLDGSGLERLFGPIEQLGASIKAAVKERAFLTCSVGAAPVKFLAKIASDLKKPDGLSIIYPEEVPAFVPKLPLAKIPGLGPQTLKQLAGFGINTAGDAQKFPEEFWERRFGKMGKVLYLRCHGHDERGVSPYTPPKSESAEHTLAKDCSDREELKTWLLRQAERIGKSLRKQGYKGRTITLKVKYADFRQITRSHSLKKPTSSTRAIYEVGAALLDELNPTAKIRLIGLGVSNFGENELEEERMLTLPGLSLPEAGKRFLPENLDEEKETSLDKALDLMRGKFGDKVIIRGKLFKPEDS